MRVFLSAILIELHELNTKLENCLGEQFWNDFRLRQPLPDTSHKLSRQNVITNVTTN